MAQTTAVPPTAQPRSLIVTVYGLYARASGDWLSVSLLIRLLAELGVDEPAVRSAISRLKRRGLLEPTRRDGVAGYALSAQAREILAEGDKRIFAPPHASVSDGWLLAVFSVPESERARRHTLRSRLAALGFGTTAPGVWVAPAHRYELTRATLVRLGLDAYVNLFRADYLAFADLTEAVAQWWDLKDLEKSYVDFLGAWSGADRNPASPAVAFATWVRALTDWRRLPYLDPGLPPELLPPDWPGARARRLFRALEERLSAPARAHFQAQVEGAIAVVSGYQRARSPRSS